MIVTFVRHGRTAWNDQRRLQGRADHPLTLAGREQVARWRLPADIAHATVVSSPLVRAVETARLLTGREPAIEADLIEMHWGEWEGETFDGLRARLGPAYDALEARGLDFRPPGGESPREVQARLLRWFARIAVHGDPVVAITHKGVLNALVASVTGWNATGRSPIKLRRDGAHVAELDAAGRLRRVGWNVPLAAHEP